MGVFSSFSLVGGVSLGAHHVEPVLASLGYEMFTLALGKEFLRHLWKIGQRQWKRRMKALFSYTYPLAILPFPSMSLCYGASGKLCAHSVELPLSYG